MPDKTHLRPTIVWAEPDAVDDMNALGGFYFGDHSHYLCPSIARLDMPVLGQTLSSAIEVWCSQAPVEHGRRGNIKFGRTEDCVFGVLSFDDLDSDLEVATSQAYAEILGYLSESGFNQVWRLWNHIRQINSEERGLERYKWFNIGRQHSFDRAAELMNGRMPAASAVGVKSGPLTIAFLAGKTVPRFIENPLQVSAYEYPNEYGPQSPSFSRAAVVTLGVNKLVLISGTASILGHKTVNLGDPYGQTITALDNIKIVSRAAEKTCALNLNPKNLYFRAYVRNLTDLQKIQQAFQDTFECEIGVHFVQADICRQDLLVEIEAAGYAD